jgi:hypothetical protein
MPENRVEQIKEAAKNFLAEIKKHDVNVKEWNVAVGKAGEGTSIKICAEVLVSPKKK